MDGLSAANHLQVINVTNSQKRIEQEAYYSCGGETVRLLRGSVLAKCNRVNLELLKPVG